MQGALAEFLHAAEIDPGNEAAQQEIARVRQKQGANQPVPEIGLPQPPAETEELESVEAPAQLKPLSNEPLSLHMTEDAKVIYQAIGKAAGINVLFDPDYNSKRIQVDLNNVSLRRCAADCGGDVEYLLAAGDQQHDFCGAELAHQAAGAG